MPPEDDHSMMILNAQTKVPQTAATSGHMRPFPVSTDIRPHPAIPGIGRSDAPGRSDGFANSNDHLLDNGCGSA